MAKLVVIFIVLFSFQVSYSQWFYQNSGTSEWLYESYFVDQNSGWIVGSNGILLKTIDSGINWNIVNSGTFYSLSFVNFFDSLNGIIAGAGGTIKKTTDGGFNWFTVNSGTTTTIHEGFFLDSNLGWLVGNNGLLMKTTNGGMTWQNNFIGPGDFQWIEFTNSEVGFACSYNTGQMWKTTDGGSSWVLKINLGVELWQSYFVDENVGWIVGDYGTVLKTTNGGENWQFQTSPVSVKLRSVYFHDYDNGWIVGKNQTILHTTNGGSTWIINQSGFLNEYLHINFFDSNYGCIVGYGGIILHTDNGGIGGITPVELASFTFDIDGKFINLQWITSSETNNYGFEIEKKTDKNIWNKIGFVSGSGTSTKPIYYSLQDTCEKNGKYYYRLKQIDLDGSAKYSDILEINIQDLSKFSLEQNFPNPFNPYTNVRFTLPYRQNVKILIYNSIGEEIYTLVNDFYDEGIHSFSFDASFLSSGIYIYSLIGENFIETKKMILIK